MLRNVYTNKAFNEMEDFFENHISDNYSQAFDVGRNFEEREKYIESYGSEEYGIRAYNLNNFRIWSMSFCIVFIWLGIYLQHKNIKLGKWIKYIAIVVFIICQLLPLGYTIYVSRIIR